MAVKWTAFDMAKALQTLVIAKVAALDPPEVRVVTYLPHPDEPLSDAIAIGYMSIDSDDNQRAHAGGKRFDEEVSLISRVQVTRPGAGQEVADQVRTRAEVLLGEVDDVVRDSLPTVGNQSWAGKVISREMAVIAANQQGIGSLLCAIDCEINYKARTS